MPSGEVAPRAGAWIEIVLIDFVNDVLNVAPRAGAWIEIEVSLRQSLGGWGRSPCGSVD